MLEQGRMSLDEYLRCTVFFRPRPFDPAEFKACMLAQSTPFPETIDLARALARSGRYRLMTINNESDELNRHRLEKFGLRDIFTAFFSSCWLGLLKPASRIYEVALAMSQAEPEASVFIDDRERNLEPARALGMQAIRFTDAIRLRQELAILGVHT
jgi:putative hydrolase of the HAD superfamily